MQPTASPRHPWKALAVVLLAFVLFHGARAHVGTHEHGFGHIHVVHADALARDCPDVDVDIDMDDNDDPDDDPVIDVFDGGDWG
jgi:hypothetical protein